jgi:hypothetical protein
VARWAPVFMAILLSRGVDHRLFVETGVSI